MKTYHFLPTKLFLIALFFLSLVSCQKNHVEEIISTPSLDEYVNYTVNGTAYSFLMPADNIIADTSAENTTFFPGSSVYAQRIPFTNADNANISYNKTNIAVGSSQQLALFAVPQTEIYPYYANSVNPIFIHITEYGNVGEFIAGNFSGTITGSAPGNIQYDVTCSFRVKRRI